MKHLKPLTRPMLAAVVLGAALTALGPTATAQGAETVSDVSRYCTTCWRNARLPVDHWPDCTQEVLARLLERVPAEGWSRLLHRDGDEYRELVRAIDTVKKRTQRSRKYASLEADVSDYRDRPERHLAEERELVQRAAAAVLSPRQQRILNRLAAGWSVPEVAAELGTTPARVSDEKYKAVHKLQRHLGIGDSA